MLLPARQLPAFLRRGDGRNHHPAQRQVFRAPYSRQPGVVVVRTALARHNGAPHAIYVLPAPADIPAAPVRIAYGQHRRHILHHIRPHNRCQLPARPRNRHRRHTVEAKANEKNPGKTIILPGHKRMRLFPLTWHFLQLYKLLPAYLSPL